MVPTGIFHVRNVPITAPGKTDRRRLRDVGGVLMAEQLIAKRTAREKRVSQTETERMMQEA
jgi:hypothetical protein